MPRFLVAIFFVLCLVACGRSGTPPTTEEEAQIDQPPAELRAQLDVLAPKAVAWLNQLAAELQPSARSLTTEEVAIAVAAGVKQPEAVRVAIVEEMPMPEDEALRAAAVRLGFANKGLAGGAIGNLIWLNRKHSTNRALLAHELIHVAQQEHMSLERFLRRYIAELAIVGYKRSPIEVEANAFMVKYK